MRYSTEPRKRKYVEGYGFLSFARKFVNKYGKKLIDTATKTEKDEQKLLLKELLIKQQKQREIQLEIMKK